MTSKSYSLTYFEHSSIWYFSIHSIWRYILIQLTHILTINSCSLFTGWFSSPFLLLAFPNFSITINPFRSDFVMNVNQLNIQSDLTSMSSWLILPHSQILSLHHFNLRSLHFQSLQFVPNWIQLPESETSPVCTSFQWTNNKNMLSTIKLAFSAIKIVFSISEMVLLENFTGVSRPLEVSFLLMVSCCARSPAYFPHNLAYSPFAGVWQSFISVKVSVPAFAPSCQKRLTGFFVRLLFFLQIKHINFKTLTGWRTWLIE